MTHVSLYAIRDVDMDFFAPPFFAASDHDAKTMVRDAIQPGSALHLYASHYHLYRLGSCDQSGDLIADKLCLCSIGDLTYRIKSDEEVHDE